MLSWLKKWDNLITFWNFNSFKWIVRWSSIMNVTSLSFFDGPPASTNLSSLSAFGAMDLSMVPASYLDANSDFPYYVEKLTRSKRFSASSDPNSTHETVDKEGYGMVETILIATVAAFLSLLTVIGNIMVMVSFKIDKQLQTISNYFLFSLAVADFAIGLISMPLYTVYLLLGYWPLGPLICDTWLALDYLASNASVLNLLIISFDRYFSVTRPLTYRAKRTTKRAAVMIASAWVISLVLWPPWIYSWPYIEGRRTVRVDKCYIQFLETNPLITFGTAIAAFYLPVTVMIVLYWRIWRETEQRQKDLTQLQADNKGNSRRSNSSDDHEVILDYDEWRKTRGGNGGKDNPGERTYVPDDSQRYLGLRKSDWKRFCCPWKFKCSLGQLRSRLDKDKKGRAADAYGCHGYGTPLSAQTPLSSSVSRCTSLSMIKDVLNLSQNKSRNTMIPLAERIAERQETINARIGERLATGGTPRPQHRPTSHSVSSDSVYTILIQLPNGGAHRSPSIKMIEGIGERNRIDGSATFPRRSRSPTLMRPEALNTNGHSSSGPPSPIRKFSQVPDLRIPLDAKIAPKQLAKSGSGGKKKKKKSHEKKQDRKAAKTLSAILLAFIITWTPYNVLVLLKTLLTCDDQDSDCIPEILWELSYCLCYINSTVNPMCYALCNASFRRTYVRILTCKWHSRRRNAANRL